MRFHLQILNDSPRNPEKQLRVDGSARESSGLLSYFCDVPVSDKSERGRIAFLLSVLDVFLLCIIVYLVQKFVAIPAFFKHSDFDINGARHCFFKIRTPSFRMSSTQQSLGIPS